MIKFCFLLLFLLTGSAYAQQQRLDSLLDLNARHVKPDSTKVVYLTQIFRQYGRMGNMIKVEEFSAKAIEVANNLPQTVSLTYIYERLGLCYHGKAMYLKAIDCYSKGIVIAQKRNDRYIEAGFYINLSALYGTISDYTKALEANQRATDIYMSLGKHDELGSCYTNIGELYITLQKPAIAYEYIQKAIVIFKNENNGINYGISSAYTGLANCILNADDETLIKLSIPPKEKYSKALEYFFYALHIAEKSIDALTLKASINDDIGHTYEKMNDSVMALRYYEAAMRSVQKLDDKETYGAILFSMGRYYSLHADLPKSFYYLNESLAIGRKTGLLAMQQDVLERLSNNYEQAGKFDSALIIYKQCITVREAIFDQQKEKEITRKQLQLDFSIKENDYKLTQQLTDNKLKNQLLLAKQQEQELILNQQQLQLISKEQELEHETYLKRQAELQNAQQQQTLLLQKNKLQSQVDKEVRDKQIAKQQVQILFDNRLRIFLFIAIALAIIIASLIFYNQRKTKQLNKVISQQKESLEQLGKVKDKIFSVVSHDMRAPVNSLMSFIEILENGNIPQEKLALYSKELKQSLHHTSVLMNNLLSWAASQMQGFNIYKEEFDLYTLTEEVTNNLAHHLQTKGVRLNISFSPGTMIDADKNMTAAILRNLLSNAVKYSYKDGMINISYKLKADHYLITVEDNGTGMQPDQLEEFNKAGNKQAQSIKGTANEKGTGLGLLLSKSFAEQMGGNIIAENKEKGMSFILSLPAIVD